MGIRKLFTAFLLVSIVFIGITVLPVKSTGKLGHGFDLFVLFVVVWTVLAICTPIVLIVRFAFKKKLSGSFLYNSLCIANGELGLYGLWKLSQGNVARDFGLFLGALLLSMLICIVMLVDIFNTPDTIDNDCPGR